ncbi:uncharacterized protein PHACADRAFT_137777 [Phanerochaete carnosa HHB-10118-sp]|uniref:Uncharacterized protein n=1 Tax=Phanerochaete carnosa (strain HHB-10118-sp) TaxID=650164 RepID=K5WJV2_PHACS|nr:uncharacterized protein PHACADRAFT_137777 [Phanerochaete carnosa HHB-10118-sp]EKM59690.1 hypothetical protein PHACADRAFT_137777 [Phanerochaete carnosa HHB-10118-sp]
MNLLFCLFGIYVWEIFRTSDFEWSLISRARKFSWPLVIFFFLCRYCMLFALIGILQHIIVTVPALTLTQFNCNALYTFNFWAGNMAILCASTSLMIRTVALWNKNRLVILLLATLGCAHWAILWRGMFVLKSTYSSDAKGCVIISTNHIFLNVSYFMSTFHLATMGVNFAVLLLTVMALARKRLHSHLWKLLFQDGLVNFSVTFVCNAAPAILNILNLDGACL